MGCIRLFVGPCKQLSRFLLANLSANAKISGADYTKIRRALPRRKWRASPRVVFAKDRASPVLYFVTCGYGLKSDTESEKSARDADEPSVRFGSSSRAPGPTR